MRVLIVGAGGHGQVVADILLGNDGSPMTPIGYVDDDESLRDSVLLGLPMLGTIADLARIPHDAIIVAVGENRVRSRLSERLTSQGERLGTAVHRTACLGKDVSLGAGSMICAGAVVNPGTRIGTGVIVNTAASVDHHSQIDDFVHVAPGVHMGGEVTVGRHALVGIGAVVLPGLAIGADAVVGGGAVVTRNVPDGACVVGIPARVKENAR